MSSDPEYLNPDQEEDAQETVEVLPGAIELISRAEHATMCSTANMEKNRRVISKFVKTLSDYATHSQQVALGMFYSLPRAGKQIIGPSVRFAEIVAPCWRNNSTGARIVGATEETVTAQGVFIDFEANVRNVKEVPRSIKDSKGNKYNPDMILTTSKAALSIAYRDAILKGGVPMALWGPAYEESKLVAVGKGISHTARIAAAMEFLTKKGITEWQIMNSVGCAAPEDMETEHLLTLRVLCEEIQRGDKTIEEVFGSPYDKEIDALFKEQGKNAAEQRMLRTSYRGRAKELLEVLRARRTPSAQGTTASTDAQVDQAAQQAAAGNAAATNAASQTAPPEPEKKSGGSRKKKDEPKPQAETTAAPEQTAQTTEEKKPEPTQQETKAEPAQEGKFNF